MKIVKPSDMRFIAVPPPKEKSKVAITSAKEYGEADDAIKEAINLLGGIKDFVKPGDTVMIKPNLIWLSKPEECETTHPAVVESIVRICKDAGAKEVQVGENTGWHGDPEMSFPITGIGPAAKRAGATICNWEIEEYVDLKVPKPRYFGVVKVAKSLAEADVIINVPKLKTNLVTTATLGVKSWVGALHNSVRTFFHQNRVQNAFACVDVVKALGNRLKLNIIDGIEGMEGSGPHAGLVCNPGVIVASSDTAAFDAVCCAVIGFDPLELPGTQALMKDGWGTGDLREIEILGRSIEEVKYPYKRPVQAFVNRYPNVQEFIGGVCDGGCIWTAVSMPPYIDPNKRYAVISGARVMIGEDLANFDEVWLCGTCACRASHQFPGFRDKLARAKKVYKLDSCPGYDYMLHYHQKPGVEDEVFSCTNLLLADMVCYWTVPHVTDGEKYKSCMERKERNQSLEDMIQYLEKYYGKETLGKCTWTDWLPAPRSMYGNTDQEFPGFFPERKCWITNEGRVIYSDGVPDISGTYSCRAESICPAHMSIQEVNHHIAKGEYLEAMKLVRKTNPLPAICGRVCGHPCEDACGRDDVEQAISIRELKRFITDYEKKIGARALPEKKPTNGKKVAIVGSGPAGLSAAYYLALEGCEVTMLEAGSIAGGMLTNAIPQYRLPRDIVQYEIGLIESLGVKIQLNTVIGKSLTLEELKSQGYQAVFVATGAQKALTLSVPGSEVQGIWTGIDYLANIDSNGAKGPDLKGKGVVVIGGGNVATDVARTAIRKGAKEVKLVCLESPAEMPAWEWEVEEAMEEGVKIHHRIGVKEMITKNGNVVGIELKDVERVFDEQNQFNPTYFEDRISQMDCDVVIEAIGSTPDLSVFDSVPVKSTDKNTIAVDPLTLQTSVPWIFAGGDMVTGPATVTEAIEHGEKAAESIIRFLNGEDLAKDRFQAIEPKSKWARTQPRVLPNIIPPVERVKDFSEISKGLDEEAAKAEARRCLNSPICEECFQCPTRE